MARLIARGGMIQSVLIALIFAASAGVQAGAAAGVKAPTENPDAAGTPTAIASPADAMVSAQTRAALKSLAAHLANQPRKVDESPKRGGDPKAGGPAVSGTKPPLRSGGPTARRPSAESDLASPPLMTPESRQAMADMDRALHLGKDGDQHAGRGEWDAAFASYRQAITLFPNWPAFYYGLAQCADAAGDVHSEIAYYRYGIYQVDRYGRHYLDIATNRLMEYVLLLSQTGQDEEALSVYRYAAHLLNYVDGKPAMLLLLPEYGPGEVAPTRAQIQAMARVGLAYVQEGNLGQHMAAMANLHDAVRLYPDSAVAWFSLAGQSGWKENRAALERARQVASPNQRAAIDASAFARSLDPQSWRHIPQTDKRK